MVDALDWEARALSAEDALRPFVEAWRAARLAAGDRAMSLGDLHAIACRHTKVGAFIAASVHLDGAPDHG